MTQLAASDAVAQGREALLRGAWADARSRFEEALAVEESPAAYEGLGVAARYLWEAGAAVSAHERGYRLARAQRDRAGAARLAAQLAIDAYSLGRISEANGWTERALMLTEESGPSEGRALALALRAHVAMLARNDPAETLELSKLALEAARAAGSTDVEIVALGLEGLALVCSGSVDDGMRLLDAATAAAVAGEVADVDMAETICCYLIDACKRVRDLDRAVEWCERVAEIASRFDDRFMFAVCRVHHADVLLWRGDWDAVDVELAQAARVLGELGPTKIVDSTVRLAELRRRQGRLDDADGLLAACEGHRLHALHAGLLALDRGDAAEALEAARRFLRRVGNGDRFERVAGLELLVRAAVQCGLRQEAADAATEIRTTADLVGTRPLQASALLAEARVSAADGDYTAAPGWARRRSRRVRRRRRTVRGGAGVARRGRGAASGRRHGRGRGRRGAGADSACDARRRSGSAARRWGNTVAARARGARARGTGPFERGDRRRALPERPDGRAPHREHVPQAAPLRPDGARRRGLLGARTRNCVATRDALSTGADARAPGAPRCFGRQRPRRRRMATTEIDAARAEAFAGRMLEILNDGMLTLLVSIGHQTGLLDALANAEPLTSEELAGKPGSTSATCASGSPG